MNLKLTFLLLTTCVTFTLFGQTGDYYNLKDVRKYRFDKLNLQTDAEVMKFNASAAEFNFISGLKVEHSVNLKSVLDRTNGFYELNELNLKNYSGDLAANVFDSCSEIETLHISILENKLSQLACLSRLKKLNILYLYIIGKPESLSDLKLIPDIQEIHVIGEFLPVQVSEVLTAVNKSFRLHKLGISLDRITDLSPYVVKLRYLSDLVIYDNLSVFNNGGIEDLTEEKISINYNVSNDASALINIRYMSANNQLAGFETAYLEKLYEGQVLELKPEEFASEEVEGEEKFFKPFKNEFSASFAKPVEFNFPHQTLRPDEEVFKIDPTNDAVITTGSGLRLIIAKNSFTLADNSDITDPVYVKISEIVTTSELLFGGINLNAGNQQYYNNQYLINVQATTSKNEVILKPNYQIKAILPTSRDSSLEYFFDYESNSWQDLNYYNSVFSSTLEPIDFFKIENQGMAVNYVLFDTSSFETRFGKQANFFLNDRLNDNEILFLHKRFYTNPDRTWTKDYNKEGKLKGVRIKRGKSLVRLQKVTPSKRNKERQYFKVVDRTELQIFSELKAFKSTNFNIMINPEDKRELSDNFITGYKYQDVRISYKLGQNTCTITLKFADGYKVLTAFITDSDDEKTMKKQIMKFNKAYKNYLHVLHQRGKSFNENNAVRYAEFQKFLGEKVKEKEKNRSTSEIRLNQLGTFGLYKLKPITFSTNLIVQYTDETGLPIDVKELYMVDSRYQTVIKLDLKNMAINPATCQLIFATDYNGEMYFANKGDIQGMNLTNNSLTYIKLNKVKVKLNTIEAFNNYIK